MQSRAMKKIEINKKLSLISEDKIDEVTDFIEFILLKSKAQKRSSVRLRGVWKNKAFDKIKDMESELKEIKKNLTDSILNRNIK